MDVDTDAGASGYGLTRAVAQRAGPRPWRARSKHGPRCRCPGIRAAVLEGDRRGRASVTAGRARDRRAATPRRARSRARKRSSRRADLCRRNFGVIPRRNDFPAMKTDLKADVVPQIQARVAGQRDTILRFMRELCAIPSVMGRIGDVGRRVIEEMRRLGFEDVRFDRMGNVLGRIGRGRRILLYDSHIDTVDVGDPSAWGSDPYQGKVEDGVLYARGAGDEKQSTPGMLYGAAMARDLGLLDDFTLYYFGNMEEDCDGLACQALVECEGIKPDMVVVGEPTEMNVYRGHKGRVELKVVAKGAFDPCRLEPTGRQRRLQDAAHHSRCGAAQRPPGHRSVPWAGPDHGEQDRVPDSVDQRRARRMHNHDRPAAHLRRDEGGGPRPGGGAHPGEAARRDPGRDPAVRHPRATPASSTRSKITFRPGRSPKDQPLRPGRPGCLKGPVGRDAEEREVELLDQRHLLDGQGQHPDDHLRRRR